MTPKATHAASLSIFKSIAFQEAPDLCHQGSGQPCWLPPEVMAPKIPPLGLGAFTGTPVSWKTSERAQASPLDPGRGYSKAQIGGDS